MKILTFINQYGKANNYVTGFHGDNDISYHSIYPTDAIEATQDNVDEFKKRCNAFQLQSVEYVDGLVKWSTAEVV